MAKPLPEEIRAAAFFVLHALFPYPAKNQVNALQYEKKVLILHCENFHLIILL
jgi:hypothetical protein